MDQWIAMVPLTELIIPKHSSYGSLLKSQHPEKTKPLKTHIETPGAQEWLENPPFTDHSQFTGSTKKKNLLSQHPSVEDPPVDIRCLAIPTFQGTFGWEIHDL